MSTQSIHIRDLVGRRVAEVFCGPLEVTKGDDLVDPPIRRYQRADGFVMFEGGLVVMLTQSMTVQPMTQAQLPAGCVPVRPEGITAYATEPYETWANKTVVDVGCSTFYGSYCLLLESGIVIGLHWNEYWTRPLCRLFDVTETPVWLHGSMPELPQFAANWWTERAGGRCTAAELKA